MVTRPSLRARPAEESSRPTEPLRLTLAAELGQSIDGAWWARTQRISRELPELVLALEGRLGGIVDIKVNWSVDGPPSLLFYGGEWKRQPIMTVQGRDATARLLVIPCRTAAAVAVMVLRQAARLPINQIHMGTEAFRDATGIVEAARSQYTAL